MHVENYCTVLRPLTPSPQRKLVFKKHQALSIKQSLPNSKPPAEETSFSSRWLRRGTRRILLLLQLGCSAILSSKMGTPETLDSRNLTHTRRSCSLTKTLWPNAPPWLLQDSACRRQMPVQQSRGCFLVIWGLGVCVVDDASQSGQGRGLDVSSLFQASGCEALVGRSMEPGCPKNLTSVIFHLLTLPLPPYFTVVFDPKSLIHQVYSC